MKKYLGYFTVLSILLVAVSCENKKTGQEKKEQPQETAPEVNQKNNEAHQEAVSSSSFESYFFGENLKNDSFFESDHTERIIELKNVGIISYFISGDQVSIYGIFYDKAKNRAIPYKNYPPGGAAFVAHYYDQKQIEYDDKYKSSYSSALRITLKNPKDVRKLKMYIASEPVLTYESKVPGTADQFRAGFIDLINIQGVFKGISDSEYPDKIYEITQAEIN